MNYREFKLPLRVKKVKIKVPFLGAFDLEVSEAETRAAWAIYVELSSRVITQPFDDEYGSLRSVLDSHYTFFTKTREVLISAGPEIQKDESSLADMLLRLLSQGLSPFMTKWNARLLEYEHGKPEEVSNLVFEKQWELYSEMKIELERLQVEMRDFAEEMKKIAILEHEF